MGRTRSSEKRRTRTRGVPTPLIAWVGTFIVCWVFAGALLVTYGAGRAKSDQKYVLEHHTEFTSNGLDLLQGQFDNVETTVGEVLRDTEGLEPNSTEITESLLRLSLAAKALTLPPQLLGIAEGNTKFSGLGVSAEAGSIGISSQRFMPDGTPALGFSPFPETGPPLLLPPWSVAGRSWYTRAGAADTLTVVSGPTVGLDQIPQIVFSRARPGGHVNGGSEVAMYSFPAANLEVTAGMVWNNPDIDGSNAYLVYLPEPDGAAPSETVNYPSGAPEVIDLSGSGDTTGVLAAAERAAQAKTPILASEVRDGQRVISAGKMFESDDRVIWVTSSRPVPFEGDPNFDWYRILTFAAILLLASAAALTSYLVPGRAQRRLALALTTGAALDNFRGIPTEVNDLAAAANHARTRSGDDARTVARLTGWLDRRNHLDWERSRVMVNALHDGPVQNLAAASALLQASGSESDADKTTAQATAAVEAASAQLDEIMRATNQFVPGPGISGLLGSLGDMADQISGPDFELQLEPQLPDEVANNAVLSTETSMLLTRVLRELALNAKKHSGSRTARLTVRASNDQLKITVEDEGVGLTGTEIIGSHGEFKFPQPDSAERRTGFGLLSVKLDVDSLGGELRLLESPTGGLCAIVQIPFGPSPGSINEDSVTPTRRAGDT